MPLLGGRCDNIERELIFVQSSYKIVSMNSTAKTSWSLLLPLVVGMIAISFAPILVRYSNAPASVQGMYRMLFTFLLMLPFAWRQRQAIRSISRGDWLRLGAAGLFLALHFLLWMESLSYTSIASSTIMLTLEPVFVAIGAYLVFKDKLKPVALIGIAASIAGAVLVSSGDFGLSESAFFGDTLSFLGTIAIAVNMIIAKQLMARVPSYVYSLLVFGITTVFFAIYNTAAGVQMTGYAPREWGLFLLLAIIPTVFGHMIFNWLLDICQGNDDLHGGACRADRLKPAGRPAVQGMDYRLPADGRSLHDCRLRTVPAIRRIDVP